MFLSGKALWEDSRKGAECTMWSKVKVNIGILEKVSSIVLGIVEVVGMLTTHR